MAVDVKAFGNTPDHLRRIWSDNPHFLAFARTLLAVLEPLQEKDKINIICDDEESTALPMYRLYRRVKIVYADARSRLASISFADDEVFSALQAADLIASLTRLQARNVFHKEEYEFSRLFKILGQPETGDRQWGFSGNFCGADELTRIAEGEVKRQQRAKKAKRDRSLLETKWYKFT